MMSKRNLVSMLLFAVLSVPMLAQGLRTSVCAVYPEISSEDSTTMKAFSMQMSQIGFGSDASNLRGYATGSFGSGVVTDQYVLTNRHVVGYAKTVKLVFFLRDTTLTYAHCPVVSSSTIVDLAAIALPSDRSQLTSLSLSKEEAKDGQDIFAVGFPGLNGEPSWQLSKGAISNAWLQMDSVDYIQHTAAIDPGSSGGPLLRKTNDQYEVIGLNTLKAMHRDRVGMAIRQSYIERFLSTPPYTGDQHVLEQIRELDPEQLETYYRILPDSMKEVLHDKDIHLPLDRILDIISYYGGVEKMQKKETKKHAITQDVTDDRLPQNQRGIGHLRDDLTFYFGYDYIHAVNGSSIIMHVPSINLESSLGYFVYGGGFLMPIVPETTRAVINGNDTTLEKVKSDMRLNASVYIGAQLPIKINATHVLVPKITVGGMLGMSVKEGRMYIHVPIRAGVDYRYQFQRSALLMGVYYSLVPMDIKHGFTPDSGVSLRLGFAF